jgi:hypothetical protein
MSSTLGNTARLSDVRPLMFSISVTFPPTRDSRLRDAYSYSGKRPLYGPRPPSSISHTSSRRYFFSYVLSCAELGLSAPSSTCGTATDTARIRSGFAILRKASARGVVHETRVRISSLSRDPAGRSNRPSARDSTKRFIVRRAWIERSQ